MTATPITGTRTLPLKEVRLDGAPVRAANSRTFPDTAAIKDVLFRQVTFPGSFSPDELDDAVTDLLADAGWRDVVALRLAERDEQGRIVVALLWADELAVPAEGEGLVRIDGEAP